MSLFSNKFSRVYPLLPKLIILLLCLQPVLDILTYWQDHLALGFSLSFFPRLLILALLWFGGFVLSTRKKAYIALAAVLGVYYLLHLYACYTNGFVNIIDDVKNYIRVMQLPITAFALITCLRACGDDAIDAIEKGILFSLLILAFSFVVSNLTGTEPHTYEDGQVGVRGYCFWPNAQSAILSLSAPIAISFCVRKWPHKPIVCVGTMVVSLAVLYFHGTRLSFFCMGVCGVGMVVVFLITKQPKKYAVILGALTLFALAMFPFSPMCANRGTSTDNVSAIKEDAAASLEILGKTQLNNGFSPVLFESGDVAVPEGMEAFVLPSPIKRSVFSDIPAADVRSEYLAYCQTLGLIHSTNKDYTYVPEDYLSMAQGVSCAVDIYERYHGLKDYSAATPYGWYDIDKEKAEQYGLSIRNVSDYSGGLYRTTAAGLLYAALPKTEFVKTCDMQIPSDVTPDLPQYEAICALYAAGVILDTDAQTQFRPFDYITRGEFAVLLAAVIQPDFRLCDEGYTPLHYTRTLPDLQSLTLNEQVKTQLYPLYEYFLPDLVHTFGIQKTLSIYGYTRRAGIITNERTWKLNFCQLKMEQSAPVSRLFGLEVDSITVGDTSYNTENDFHSIYYLYGWTGLALLLLFLAFFLYQIVRALIRDFKNTFTLQTGGLGVALVAPLMHSYFTCGVLQRANTLFYFGALLAAIYYLTVLKKKTEA